MTSISGGQAFNPLTSLPHPSVAEAHGSPRMGVGGKEKQGVCYRKAFKGEADT